jgi:hypothetical protein
MRFLRYVMKQKYVKSICDAIAPPGLDAVVVGFGDWSGGSQSCISRKHCGPLEDIKRELRSRKNVWFRMVDEHKTSQIDSETHEPLRNMKAWTTSLRRDANGKMTRRLVYSKVHKVLHCQPNAGVRCPTARRQTTWNRDVNASRNILKLLQLEVAGLPRPEVFCRAKKKD